MQTNLDLSSSSSLHPDEEREFAAIAAKMSEDFDFKLNFFASTEEFEFNTEESEDDDEADEHGGGEDDEVVVVVDDEDEDDFSFAINGSDSSTISGDGVAYEGEIRPYFPLFNQDLLLAPEDYKISENRLPRRPPVEKVFIETPPTTSSSSEKTEEGDGIAAGPYCAWEKAQPELSKKSNSTGFSKLWRFKEYMHRSHSDGRDAFVFLNNSEAKVKVVKKKPDAKSLPEKKPAGECLAEKKPVGEVKANATGEKKLVKKVQKKTPVSAHEIYLRSKGYHPDEDKRRSYLPYKPELVGFFTNVNGGGLSKNVHPY